MPVGRAGAEAEEGVPQPRVLERGEPVVPGAVVVGVGLAALGRIQALEELEELGEEAVVGAGPAPLPGALVPEELAVREAAAAAAARSGPQRVALMPEELAAPEVVAEQRSTLLPVLPPPKAPHSWQGTDLSHRWDLSLTTSPRRLGRYL